MITTTLNKIISVPQPWLRRELWNLLTILNRGRSQDDPIPFSEIVEKVGFKAALWCCRTVPEYEKDWCLYCVWCYESVKHLAGEEYVKEMSNITKQYVNGDIPKEKLDKYWADCNGNFNFSEMIGESITGVFANMTACSEGEEAGESLKRAQKEEFLRIVN